MNYYYLIAGLPNLSLDMDSGQIDYEKTFALIRRNLTPDHNKILNYLLFYNDARNLLSVLFQEYHDLTTQSFIKPSVFSEEEVSEYRLTRRNFPEFINDFLVDHEDRFKTMSMQEMEDVLFAKFYEEVFNIDNQLVKEYFSFYQEVQSLIAAFNFNAHDFLSRPSADDMDRLIGQIGPSRSPTTSVQKDYPYVEELLEKLSGDEPQEMEHYIDRILWDFLEDGHIRFFNVDEVFAYTIKLLMTQRWSKLNAEKGLVLFEKLHEKIENHVRSPKTPVI